MYHTSNFLDRHFAAFSVPPSSHPSLPANFQELSRIHFYLGKAPIDEMVTAVKNASLEDIEKGQIQIYFAVKEIQDFLHKSSPDVSNVEESLEPSYYFEKSFQSILQDTISSLQQILTYPTKKHNFEIIQTMIPLVHECILFNQELKNIGMNIDISSSIQDIKNSFEKIYSLKPVYPNLQDIPTFDFYEKQAQESLMQQFHTPYNFNYQELKNIYYDSDDWMKTLHFLSKEREKMDDPHYVFHPKEMQKLKDNFLKQLQSFHQLLNPGIINYVHAFSASISQEISHNISLSMIHPETAFQTELTYLEKSSQFRLDPIVAKKNDLELKKFKESKEEFIQKQLDNLSYAEKQLILFRKKELNISQTLLQVQNSLNISLPSNSSKNPMVFEGDISKGFVIGTSPSFDKVVLIHKDSFVQQPEAVYAMVVDKSIYQNLVDNHQLNFTKELREQYFSNACNFYNYGQFLQEISSSDIQKRFFGEEFELIDQTIMNVRHSKKNKLNH
jgi:hypothetical protein